MIANLKPHLLSLRELYMVALSYKDEPEKFYKIIETSVKIYPTNPAANLNAANAAIERGNIRDGGYVLADGFVRYHCLQKLPRGVRITV